MKNAPQHLEPAASKSRIIINDIPDATAVNRTVCESCHWNALATRRFRGRVLCLACIAEHFSDEETDE